MAGASLLTLLDDIATLMDDVAFLTKVAARKTAGVLGDDLALNAEQVTGVRPERELPVVWAVFKGSALNKLILVPAALLLSALIPWVITPLLMLGGAFLCYEGFEKVAHRLLHSKAEDDADHSKRLKAVADRSVDMVKFEKKRIKGAIRTDAILSAEIIVIALGTVQDAELAVRIGVLCAIAVGVTLGVYGLVAAIVKLDDLGMMLLADEDDDRPSAAKRRIGEWILRFAPWLMKGLSIVGTAAMFLVGGGILVHGIPPVAEMLHHLEEAVGGGIAATLVNLLFTGIFGIIAGGLLVALHKLIGRLLPGKASATDHH